MVTPLTFPIKVLAAPLPSTGDRLILPDIKHWDGNDLTSAEVGTVIYATLQDFGRTKLEIIALDPTTLNVATTTGILITKRKLAFNGALTETETAELWTANESFVMLGSNPPQLLDNMMDTDEAQTITAVKTFTVSPIVPTPTTPTQAASKGYVDGVAIVGAPDADTVTKGIVQRTLVSEINSDSTTGSTGAIVVPTPADLAASKYGLQLPTANEKAALVGTSGTAVSVSNKLVDNADTTTTASAGKVIRGKAVTGKLDESVCQMTDAVVADLTDNGYTEIHHHIWKPTASDTIQASLDATKTVNSASTLTVTKEFSVVVPQAGTMRVSFDYRLTTTGGSGSVNWRVYVDGSALGTQKTLPYDFAGGTAWQTFSEDLTIPAGDVKKIQLYASRNTVTGETRNFRLSFTKTASSMSESTVDVNL